MLTPFWHRVFSPGRKLSKRLHAESPESTTMAGDNRAGLLYVAIDDRDLVLLRAKAVSSEGLGARAGRSSPQQGRQSLWHEQARTPVSRCDSTPNLAPRGTRKGRAGRALETLPQSSFATVATWRGEEQSLTLQRPQARPTRF